MDVLKIEQIYYHQILLHQILFIFQNPPISYHKIL